MSSVSRRDFLRCLSLGLTGMAMSRFASAVPETGAGQSPIQGKHPNIIFIIADDIGYGDFGCYGATKVKTPNVDRLAREGVRFTDAHSSGAVCTPTRYSLMTGQYAFRNPAGSAILSGEAPLSIDPQTTTLPSMLRGAGYATGLVGKWHLGLGQGGLDFNQEIKPGPLEVGFDYAFFIPATGDRTPCVYVENHKVVGLDPNDPIKVSYGAKVGDEPTGRENPELLTMKPSHGHDNTIVNGISRIGYMAGGKAARWEDTEIANTIAGKSIQFIEKNKDKPFFLYMATHDIHVPRVPNKKYAGKSGCGTRGDVIEEFDGTVGAVMDALDRLGLAENTLVFLTSDNGGVLDDGYQDGAIENLNGHKCNGPLRGFKGSLWEGGHRVPYIVRWPKRIEAGKTSDELICTIDTLASLAALTGQKLANEAAPDSYNMLPALLGEGHDLPLRDHLVLQSNGTNNQAIRKGDWVLIQAGGGAAQGKKGKKTAQKKAQAVKKTEATKAAAGFYGSGAGVQLYNLKQDLAETNNLAEQHPEIVNDLREMLQKIKAQGRSRS